MEHIKVANLYIATLQSLAIIQTHCHWLTRGNTFYGDHLLFERIYKNTLEDLDLAAEKLIGLFGDAALDYDTQTELLHKVLGKYSKLEGSPTHQILAAEKDFLKLSQQFYDILAEGKDLLSLGLDDALMSIASRHEENTYLLKQRLK
jgi:DNA-binding ferritin-like protein